MRRGVYLWLGVVLVINTGVAWSQTTEKILTRNGDILDLQGRLLERTSTGGQVRFSPNRKRLVFVLSGVGDNILVINRDGTNEIYLTDGEEHDQNPDWSPDGTTIVFSRGLSEGQDPLARTGLNLYKINEDGTELTQLTHLPGDEIDPKWSPDGSLISFTARIFGTGEHQVFTVRPDGTGLTQLTYFPPRPGSAGIATWSPDSRQIAFVGSTEDRTLRDVYLMNIDGSGMTNITNHPSFYGTLCWSPDETRIGFIAVRDDKWGLHSIKVDGSDEQLMMRGAIRECSQWFLDDVATLIESSSWGQIKNIQ